MFQADDIWYVEGQIILFLFEDPPTHTSSLVGTY